MTTTRQPFDRTLRAEDLQADHETRAKNEARQGTADYVDICFLCGRPLTEKSAANGWMIHLDTGGTLVRNDQDDHPDLNSQGCFPVGSECAKRIPATHKAKAS